MTYFLKNGTRFQVSTKESLDLHEKLPAETYTIKYDQMGGTFFLESIEGFKISSKVYGETPRQSERILSTFTIRDNSTGVLLSGEQGSGKTLLAKYLSLEAKKLGFPTIVINNPWCGEQFNGFLQMIEQPTVIIFDEFEKVYDREDQEKLLTLLDGVYPSKKLFVFTCNDPYRVNGHMRNRPGRIFYRIEYSGLGEDFVREYCEDNLLNKSQVESVVRASQFFSEFSFDMLQALVEEMNRYDETPGEAMAMLNAKPEQSGDAEFDITLLVSGVEVKAGYDGKWSGNPLSTEIEIGYVDPEKEASDGRGLRSAFNSTIEFTTDDLVDVRNGAFVYRKGDIELMLKKTVYKAPAYMDF